MKENSDIFSPNLLNNDIKLDSSIKKLQQNLFLMGFDIIMINKIITYFNITSESEAIDYLIKDDSGMWHHPFIPKEKLILEKNNNSSILGPPKIVNNVFTKIKNSSMNNEIANSNIIIENDFCDICEESINYHLIKKYEIKDNISINTINSKEEEKKEIIIEEEKEESNPNECPICMGEYENPLEIENCKHKFCFDCFNNYLNDLITRNNIDKIPCPKNKCPNDNLSEEFFSQYLSEEQYFKYRQFKSQNEIARDSKKIFCPHCNSYAQLSPEEKIPDPNSPEYIKFDLKCQNEHIFCSCGRPKHEGPCFKDEQEFKELIVLEKIKKCPKCGFLIKKNNGCNHMTCGNPLCKYEFCWLCMNEAVPNHYDFGPCAGKQFFDPDSFSNKLRLEHPRLYILFNTCMIILAICNFLISFIICPAIGLSAFSYYVLYVEDEDIIRDKTVKFFEFLICICISLCGQSLIYMFWIIGIAAIALIIILIPIIFVGAIIYTCCYGNPFPAVPHHENGVDDFNPFFDEDIHSGADSDINHDNNIDNNQSINDNNEDNNNA